MCIRKYIIEFFIIILMFGLFLYLNQDKEIVNAQEVKYLKQNASYTIKLDEVDLNANKAYIVSELHGFKQNTIVKYDFLTYLNREKNVSVYVAEISFSSGYLLNEYLKTGNKKILDDVFSFYQGSTFYMLDEYQFYENLYKYNLSVSDDKKVSVIGIDIEHTLDSALYFYNYYHSDNVESIEDIIAQDYDDKLLNMLKQNIIASLNFYDEINWQERDNTMYQNYLILQKYYGFESFYAQVGAKHGFSDRLSDGFLSLTYYLKHDINSPVLNQVLSIMIFYKDSECLKAISIHSDLFYQQDKIKRTYKTNNLDVLCSNFSLIKLNRKDSPYTNKLIWYHLSDNKEDKVTTDYYQYLILICHSKSQTPIDEPVKLNPVTIYYKILKQIIFNK